ncbi:hypothetical protein RAS2_02810 [Phycisphaerae bacterium RAS2]|nr:hypothetical protein RAS2_02810 [Phycisphaerae bacterium RAS2]
MKRHRPPRLVFGASVDVPHCCDDMAKHLREHEVAIVYWDKYRQYGISVLDGGASIQTIRFCPWCGRQLPDSLRTTWFERLEALGKEPEDDLPLPLQSGEWWRSEGL